MGQKSSEVTVEILLMKNTIDVHIFLKSLMRLERNNFIEEATFFHPCILGWEDLTQFLPPIDLITEGILEEKRTVELRFVYLFFNVIFKRYSSANVCALTPATPVTVGTQNEDVHLVGGPFLSSLLKQAYKFLVDSGISIKNTIKVVSLLTSCFVY
jgi:hypothetical protein